MTRWLPVMAFVVTLFGCRKKLATEEVLETVEASWSIVATVSVKPQSELTIDGIQDEGELDAEVAGHTVWINNYISDSRGTVMDFGEWNRLLTESDLSEEDRLMRIPMIGQSGIVYPFSGTGANKGFLVFSTAHPATAWAEVWDQQETRRVRVDFRGKAPTPSDVTPIAEGLAGLEWPKAN